MSDEQRAKYSLIEKPEQFLPQAQKIIDLAKRKGAQFADAVISLGRDISIGAEKSSIKSAEVSWGKSLSIRVFIDGGLGDVSASDVEDDRIDELVEKAIELAKIATPDPDFVSLPMPEKPVYEPATFDEKILSVTAEQAIQWMLDNIQAAQSVDKDVIVSGDVGLTVSSAVLASSTGISVAKKSTSIHIGFFCVVRDDNNIGSFADHDSARFIEDCQPAGLAEKVTRRAIDYLNQKKAGTFETTLVLAPQATFSLMHTLARLANAESIQRNRSLFADKLNSQIANPAFTLLDDGLVDKGLSSGCYDGEGAVRKKVTIIDNGRFVGQLHNSYTANKAKTANTGHGLRNGGIAPSNLQLLPGKKTADDIIKEVEDGVYLELGGLSPDPVSGDISTNLDFAFKIEKGQLAFPLANAMIAGNLLELLSNIDAISSDYRYEPGNIMPTVRIRNVQISSGER